MPKTPIALLLLITFLAVLVHGYHLGVDDSEIYIPAIKQVADPALYPFGSEFFESHAHLSLFAEVVGESARWTHLPINLVIFLWHGIGIFLLLVASWQMASACFETAAAHWAAVGVIAGVLSVPVAGTALILMDPYLTARSLSTPATLLAVASYVSGKPRQAVAWLLFTALIHVQMAVYCAVFLGCLAWAKRVKSSPVGTPELELVSVASLAFLFNFEPAQGAAREALYSRSYFFVTTWTWYEWIGVIAPLAILWTLASAKARGTTPVFRSLARTLVLFGLLFTAAGLVLAESPPLENLARLQPMRAFHLLYVIFFLLLGGLLGEYVLRSNVWRWIGFFGALAGLMWIVQWQSFPFSPHVEWPGTSLNEWTSAFFWVRDHTSKNDVFALDPEYMLAPEADLHGFRAIAERSALAENVKDSGAVSMFPQLAGAWKKEVLAQTGLEKFQLADFEKLSEQFPVTWVITQHPQSAGLLCPYQSGDVAVCRIDHQSLLLAALSRSKLRAASLNLDPAY